jgi:hypothetical protein
VSDLFGALALTVGLNHSQYLDQSYPEQTFKVSLEHEDYPVYVWGGYEELGIRILGQGIGDSSISSVGLGARKTIGDFFVFGEVGYGFIDEGANHTIQQEIVYTTLVHNHESEWRPVPVNVTRPYDQSTYETSWELEDGIMGRLGVGYELGKDFKVTLAYRPFFVKEFIQMWDVERRAAGRGWWQEGRNRDLSSFEVGISYTFK